MSASEKLKALDEAGNLNLEIWAPLESISIEAEIRALVEAVERDLVDGVVDGPFFMCSDASVQMLRDALDALDEALS